MKYSIILTLLFAVSFIINSCGDDNTISENTQNLPITTISGRIENWQSGRMNLKAVVSYHEKGLPNAYYVQTIDSTFINEDKTFTINLSAPIINPIDSFYMPNQGTCSNNVNISPSTTKFKMLRLEIYNQNDSAIGYILRSDADTNTEHQNAERYLYNDVNTSIEGARTCFSTHFTIQSNYDYTALKGWNKFNVNLFNSYSLAIERYSNISNGSLKWRYSRYIIY